MTAYTEGDPGANKVQLQTIGQIPLVASNRFLTFSVNTSAFNCNVSAPLYQFYLTSETGEVPVGGQINACTSTKTVTVPGINGGASSVAKVGTYTSKGSVLFTGSSLGIRMTNANGSGTGNDAAFDDIRVLDVTPHLDKSFSPAAGSAGASTTCSGGTVAATAGGSTIGVTGNLEAEQASCTVTVNVTSSTVGDHTNGPDNVATTGLNAPGSTTLNVVPPTTPPGSGNPLPPRAKAPRSRRSSPTRSPVTRSTTGRRRSAVGAIPEMRSRSKRTGGASARRPSAPTASGNAPSTRR